MATEIFQWGTIATLTMNHMGHIHIWQGIGVPIQVSKYNYHMNGREADLYFQSDADIDAIRDLLSADQWDQLNNGYTVHAQVHDEYFLTE